MKRLLFTLSFITIAVISISCGTAKNGVQSSRMIHSTGEQCAILLEHYPQLYSYYTEGVMKLWSIKEIQFADGTKDWKVKYGLKSLIISDYSEQMEILKSHFPEIYNLYSQGKATISLIYKYVAKDGSIRYNVSWRNVYSGLY